ncbi:unnamed protein product [Scytosiphon promiscuus]
MQDMHREVGSAVLLLSRFIGLEWDTSEVVRLVEAKTSSASVAVKRLSENVGTLEQRLASAEKSESVGGQEIAGDANCTAVVSASAAEAGHHAQKPGLLQGGGASDVSALRNAANGTISPLPSCPQEGRKCNGDPMVGQSKKDVSSSGDDRDAGQCQPLASKMPHKMSASSPTGRPSMSSESMPSSSPSSSPSPRRVVEECSDHDPSELPSATGNGSSSSNHGAEGRFLVDSGHKQGKSTCDLPLRSFPDEHRGASLSSLRENCPDDRTQHQPPATLLPPLRRSSLGSSSVAQVSVRSKTATPGAGMASTSPTSAALGATGGVFNAAPSAEPGGEEQQPDSTGGISLVAVHRSEKGLPSESGSEKMAIGFSSEGENLGEAQGEVSSAFAAVLEKKVGSEQVCGNRGDGIEEGKNASKGERDERSKKYPVQPADGGEPRGGTVAAITLALDRTLSESDTLTTGDGTGVTAVSTVSKLSGLPVAENFTEDGNSAEVDRNKNANSVDLATASAADPTRSTAPLKETSAPAEGVASSSSPREETLLAAQRDGKDEGQSSHEEEKEESYQSQMTREEDQQNDPRMATNVVVSSTMSAQGGLATSDAVSDAAASKGGASPFAEKTTPEKNIFGGQDDGAGERGGGGAKQEVPSLTDGTNYGDSQSPLPETRDRSAFVRTSLAGARRPDDAAIPAVRPENLGPMKPQSISPVGAIKFNPVEARSTRQASIDYAVGAPESHTTPKRSRDGKLRDGGNTESEEPNDTLRTGRGSSEEGQGVGMVKSGMLDEMRSTQREENGTTMVLRETNENGETGHACTDGSRDCGGNRGDSGSSSSDDSSKTSEGSSWANKTRASSGPPSSGQSTPSTARNALDREGILRVTDGATDGSDSGCSSGGRKGSASTSKTRFRGENVGGVDKALSSANTTEK